MRTLNNITHFTTSQESLPNCWLFPHLKTLLCRYKKYKYLLRPTCLLMSLVRIVITKLTSLGCADKDWITCNHVILSMIQDRDPLVLCMETSTLLAMLQGINKTQVWCMKTEWVYAITVLMKSTGIGEWSSNCCRTTAKTSWVYTVFSEKQIFVAREGE